MSVSFAAFDLATGAITSSKSVAHPGEVAANVPPGRGHVMGDWGADAFFVDLALGIPVPRPAVPVMSGADYDLSLLPEGGALVVTDPAGFSTTIPAQADRLELVDAGAYRVRSECPFPYVNFEREVIVP